MTMFQQGLDAMKNLEMDGPWSLTISSTTVKGVRGSQSTVK